MEVRVRDVDQKLLRAIDREAKALVLSRSEFVRYQLERAATPYGAKNEIDRLNTSIQKFEFALEGITENVDEVKKKVDDLMQVVVNL